LKSKKYSNQTTVSANIEVAKIPVELRIDLLKVKFNFN